MKKGIKLFIILLLFLNFYRISIAGENKVKVFLKNGDILNGVVIWEDSNILEIQNENLGSLTLRKDNIKNVSVIRDKPLFADKKEESNPVWTKEISLGYDKSSGNTQNSNLAVSLFVNKKTTQDEITIKGDTFYSSADNKMDAQKWYGMLRYGKSFWDRKWYRFYKLESDHDRFADINYRIVPSLGFGYWFADLKEFKAMLEAGLGFEHTDFRDNTPNNNRAVLVPGAFLKRRLLSFLVFSQELYFYKPLDRGKDYRLRSETAFINPINEKLAFKFSLIDNFDSYPPKDIKKNDFQMITSLSYSF